MIAYKFKAGDLVTPNPDSLPIGDVTPGIVYEVLSTDEYRKDGTYNVFVTTDTGQKDGWWSYCWKIHQTEFGMEPDYSLEEIHKAQEIYIENKMVRFK